MACAVKSSHFPATLAALALLGVSASAQTNPPPLAPLPPTAAEETPDASAAPADVVASAVTAVAALGKEVVLGRYQVAVERMNPLWKERVAKRMGGKEELEKQLAGVASQMVQQGISMISFKPQGRLSSFEVGPGRKVETVAGQQVESLVFLKWMVLIPTVTKFRILPQGQTKPLVIDSTGYQVAVADKGSEDWTFIDGSGLTVNDLRSLYATLPKNLELPPVSRSESR